MTKLINKTGTKAHRATATTKTEEKKTMRKTKVEKVTAVERKGKCTYVKTTDIKVGTTVRLGNEVTDSKVSKKFRALEKSIIANGILTPIIVKKDDTDNTYTVVDGFRRLAVAKRLDIKKLQVISYDDIDNKEELLSIVANSNQKVLTVIEAGVAYKKLIDRGIYGSKRKLAEALGVSESTVGAKINNLRLDKRIIDDLLAGSEMSDQKVLKAIRSIEAINNDGESENQWEVYSYIKTNTLNRKDAIEYIKGQKENNADDTTAVQHLVKKETDKKIEVTIDKEGLSEAQLKEIDEMINKMMNELDQHSTIEAAA